MSPEQADGETDQVDERSDVHALGVILYQILVGRLPFPGRTLPEVLAQIREHAPPRPRMIDPSLSRLLEAVCLKAMAKRREDRYGRADELAADLERFLADEPVTAHAESLVERAARRARRHRTMVVSVAVAVLVTMFAGVSGYFLWREQSRQNRAEAARFDSERQSEEARLQAEARRREDERVADLRRAAESGELFALAELRRGQFASAENLLRQAIETLGSEPRLVDLSAQLRERFQRAHGIVEFYRITERAEKNAFLEYDGQSVVDCERAIASLGLPATPDWPKHLPTDELTDPAKLNDPNGPLAKLREDVHRTMTLQLGERLKMTFMRDWKDPRTKADLRAMLELARRCDGLRPTFSTSLVKVCCHFMLGEVLLAGLIPPVQPRSATDFYFSGMAHFWVEHAFDSAVTKSMREPRVQGALKRIGLDFANAATVGPKHLRAAADLAPQHYWTRPWLAWSLQVADPANATEAFGACVALRPDYWLGFAFRGRALSRLVGPATPPTTRDALRARARRDFDEAVRLDPLEAKTFWQRGDDHWIFREWDAAVVDLQRCLDLSPPLDEWGELPIRLQMQQQTEAMKRLATDRVQANANDANALVLLGESTFALAEAAHAKWSRSENPFVRLLGESTHHRGCDYLIACAASALRVQPNHVGALTARGRGRLHKGLASVALEDFQSALVQSSRSTLAQMGAAQSLERLGRCPEALAAYQSSINEFSLTDWQRGDAHLGRARCLVAMNRNADARTAAMAAVEFKPDEANRLLRWLPP